MRMDAGYDTRSEPSNSIAYKHAVAELIGQQSCKTFLSFPITRASKNLAEEYSRLPEPTTNAHCWTMLLNYAVKTIIATTTCLTS
jgi:hypothetical protein